MASIYVYPSEASDKAVLCDSAWEAADCLLRHNGGRFEVRQDRDRRGRFTGFWTVWHAESWRTNLTETTAFAPSAEAAMAEVVNHAMEWWPGVVVISSPLPHGGEG